MRAQADQLGDLQKEKVGGGGGARGPVGLGWSQRAEWGAPRAPSGTSSGCTVVNSNLKESTLKTWKWVQEDMLPRGYSQTYSWYKLAKIA